MILFIVTSFFRRDFVMIGEHSINTRTDWCTMHDSNYDSGNETHDSVDRDLARELLSEDELRYFAGQKKKSKPKSSTSAKRDTLKSAPEESLSYDSVKAITRFVTNAKNQQAYTNLNPEKTSTLLTKKGSGLQILIASIILVLLVSAAVIFTLKANDSLPTSKNLSSANDKASIDRPIDKQMTISETSSDDNDTAVSISNASTDNDTNSASSVNEVMTPNVPVENANIHTEALTAANVSNNDSAKDNNQPIPKPIVTKKTSKANKEVAKEQPKNQNEQQDTVSYEDFAKEAQSTLYRDSDY